MILSKAVERSVLLLAQAGIERPHYDACWIIGAITNVQPDALEKNKTRVLRQEELDCIDTAIKMRAECKSISRIFGMKLFYGTRVLVEDGVFEPVGDTEHMVRNILSSIPKRIENLKILDLCTGCGNILIALLGQLKNAEGLGIDCNPKAVDLAKRNAALNGLDARARFFQGDLGREVSEQFDIIVANCPFAREPEIPRLPPDTLRYEPYDSLAGGDDGLRFFRLIAEDLRRIARPNAKGFFQVVPGNVNEAYAVFEKAGHQRIKILYDKNKQCSCLMVNVDNPAA